MDAESFRPLLDWMAMHPAWAACLVFATALVESLALLGLLIPGALMLFGFGALVAAGVLNLWLVLGLAVLGAVVGDGIGFWLGYHYHAGLLRSWPFRRYPRMFVRGREFFEHHGGKSVLLGRFVAPVRPVIPIIAGIMRMSPWRFCRANLLSALLWAPLYILSGLVFGVSLGLAAEVTSRLVVLVLALFGLSWAGWWLVHRVFRLIQPRATLVANRVLGWGQAHPRLGRPVRALLDPARKESGTLLGLALLLLACAWGFIAVLTRVLDSYPGPLDHAVVRGLQDLRSPPGDQLMVFFTQLGDGAVLGPLALAVLAWLALRSNWLAAGHWAAAVALGYLLSLVLKAAIAAPRPGLFAFQGIAVYAFPSGHATMATVVYGFLAVLVASGLPTRRRWLPVAAAALLISPIAFSRLYLGVHWFSDVLGGLALGGAWVAILAIAYMRHRRSIAASVRGLALASVATLVVAGGVHIGLHQSDNLRRYAVQQQTREIALDDWWQGGWRELPTYRSGLRGVAVQPLTLQWAGSIEAIAHGLEQRGWKRPLPLTPATSLRWLAKDPRLDSLPLYPRLLEGVPDVLRLTLPGADGRRLLVLRLWDAGVRLLPRRSPLWLGYVGFLQPEQHLSLITWLRTDGEFDIALEQLSPYIDGMARRRVRREQGEFAPGWDGRVWLVRGEPH